MPRRWRLGAALALVVSLSACQPLYLPLVPERLPAPALTQLGDGSSLTLQGGVPTLHLVLARVPERGWLAVQWFAPDGREAASDSVWIDPAAEGEGRTLTLPARVAVTPGEWRAVVSFGHDIVRQFRLELPAAKAP